MSPGDREQPWRDEEATSGRLVLLSHNPISEAAATIAEAAGRDVVLVEPDEQGAGTAAVADLDLGERDALVLCDHDAPDAPDVLRQALRSSVGYVAMMASRGRSAALLDELRAEGFDAETLDRLHVPAGLDTGGKQAGEIALSVVAEVVAVAHGRRGGPMKEHHA